MVSRSRVGSASSAWTTVALLCLLGLSVRPVQAKEARPDLTAAPLAESRAHLAAGELDEALAKALVALELAPERVDLLDHASTCAEKAGHADEALFYAWIGLSEARVEGFEPVDLDRRAKRVARLDPLKSTERPDLDGHSRRLLAIGTNCIDRKLYANAVEFLHRCKDTASGPEAEAQLEKLYGNDRSLDALLETGIDVPVRDETSRRARQMIRQDPEHEAWEDAWRIKGRNYTIVTNVGWQFASEVSLAMEQLHPYYCRVFLGKRGSVKTARCTICIYRDLDEFLEEEPAADEETLGFYQPGENRIATYDPRSEGEGLDSLWETLFHEASHQFTDMVTTGTVPAWLNEGTAAYFEGAHLLPSGRVVANDIPGHRLSGVKAALDENYPTVREVVAYFEDGSYDGSYYPVGWGLVYFLLNYEDESCKRVYAPLYESYMKTYRKGGKHDSFERFEKYFVSKAKQPEVRDFAQLKVRFKQWIDELHELEFGGGEKVEDLLQRARLQLKKSKHDAALASYRWALEKSPRHRPCLLELAEFLVQRGRRDPGIFYYRRLLEILDEARSPDEEIAGIEGTTVGALRARIRERLAEVDPTMVQLQEGAEREFRERAGAAADLYAERGFPRTAMLTLKGAIRLLGRAPALEEQRRRILDQTTEDVWRWRRFPAERGLDPWYPSGDWETQDGALAIETRHRGVLLCRESLPPRYRLEATVKISEMRTKPFVGLLFGVGDSGILNVWGTKPGGTLEANRIVADLVRREKVGKLRGEVGDAFRLAVEIDGGWARFFVDGALVGKRYYEPKDIQGRAGLMVEGSTARFTDVRLGI